MLCGNVIQNSARYKHIQIERPRNPGKERNQLSVKEVNAESQRDERSAYKKQ